MSGAPKRPHEDSSHPSSENHRDDSNSNPKLSSTVSSDYHIKYDIGPESRAAKIAQTESRDGDRRSPLHVGYRAPSSSNDAHVVHPDSSKSRLEYRNLKDVRDYRFENQDNKMDKRECHGDTSRDSQNPTSDKDSRIENRGDDTKESRYGKDSRNEAKFDWKLEITTSR